MSAEPLLEPLLELSGVSAFYGKLCAVRDISLRVMPGETVCVIGPNGAGKTTLLKAISGVLRSVRGVIRLAGVEVSERSPQSRVADGLIHVPEGRQIFGAMTVEENIRIGAFTHPERGTNSAFDDALALFPRLQQRRKQLAGTLSGGEQQMLAMARAVMGRPRVLMLDEPSMGLAPIVVTEIYRQIDRLKERGVTILLVEQNAKLALAHSDRALLVSAGELRHQGSCESIRNDRSLTSLVFGH
ncbi:MAG: amino acid/amide transporter ATP-binding protein 2, family [Rhizobacter sp.]|nr:amino acid/amide transporter ATP-binding protein 2, family [Rhizobacter sp.]